MVNVENESKNTLYHITKATGKTCVSKAVAISTDNPIIIFLGGAKYTSEPEEKFLRSAEGTIEPLFSIPSNGANKNIGYYSIRSNNSQKQLTKSYLAYNKSPLNFCSDEALEIASQIILKDVSPLHALTDNERMLAIEKTKKAFSKINFVAFSYGCCLVEEVGNALGILLQNKGYSQVEARDVIKCLGAVSVAPVNVYVKKEYEIPQLVLLAKNDEMSNAYNNIKDNNPDISWLSEAGEMKVAKVETNYCILQNAINTHSYSLGSDETDLKSKHVRNGHSRRLYTATFSQYLDNERIADFFPSSSLGEIYKDAINALLDSTGNVRNTETVWDTFFKEHLQAEHLKQYFATSTFFKGVAERIKEDRSK